MNYWYLSSVLQCIYTAYKVALYYFGVNVCNVLHSALLTWSESDNRIFVQTLLNILRAAERVVSDRTYSDELWVSATHVNGNGLRMEKKL